jgi:hypothetical protein
MTYHWYARWRLAQLVRQFNAHRTLCADCQGRFLCATFETLRTKVKHWQRVENVA